MGAISQLQRVLHAWTLLSSKQLALARVFHNHRHHEASSGAMLQRYTWVHWMASIEWTADFLQRVEDCM